MTALMFRRILLDCSRRNLHTTARSSCIMQRDPKSGYKTIYYNRPPPQNLSIFGRVCEGYRQFKQEFGIWLEEVKEHLRMDPLLIYRQDEVDIVWEFNGNPKALDQWVLTCDSDYEEGYSTAKLEMSSIGTGIFSGTLSTQVPKDGRIVSSGYCNMKTLPKEKSFKRTVYHDWTAYTHLVLRIRGDGRTYGIVISNKGYFDMLWNDTYMYPLWTRGGPYWQIVRIPFSRFVFSSKGRVQDEQSALLLFEVLNIGITLADDVPGNFRLEIAYIGLEQDESHTEECAYEAYNLTGIKF